MGLLVAIFVGLGVCVFGVEYQRLREPKPVIIVPANPPFKSEHDDPRKIDVSYTKVIEFR